jgi:hypothetical protein
VSRAVARGLISASNCRKRSDGSDTEPAMGLIAVVSFEDAPAHMPMRDRGCDLLLGTRRETTQAPVPVPPARAQSARLQLERCGEPLPILTRFAEHYDTRPSPLEVQMRWMLPGEAHPSVNLDIIGRRFEESLRAV